MAPDEQAAATLLTERFAARVAGMKDSTQGNHARERPWRTNGGNVMAQTTLDPKVFEGLTISPSDEPLPEPARGSTAGPNPFAQPVMASVEHGTPYNVYLPANAVQRAVFLINQAARKGNVGVRVVVNVERDADGKVVKGADGKSVPIVEKGGANRGKVLVRFQGKAERKQQTAPRPYSIVKDKASGEYIVRRRSDKVAMFKGTHEAAKAEYDRLKTEFLNTPQAPATTTPAAE